MIRRGISYLYYNKPPCQTLEKMRHPMSHSEHLDIAKQGHESCRDAANFWGYSHDLVVFLVLRHHQYTRQQHKYLPTVGDDSLTPVFNGSNLQGLPVQVPSRSSSSFCRTLKFTSHAFLALPCSFFLPLPLPLSVFDTEAEVESSTSIGLRSFLFLLH